MDQPSDSNQQTTTTNTNPQEPAAPNVAGNAEILENLKREVLEAARAEIKASQASQPDIDAKVEGLVKQRLKRAIGEEDSDDSFSQQLLVELANNPSDFFTRYGEAVSKRTEERLLQRLSEQEAEKRNKQEAATKVFKSRKDILGSKEAINLVTALYEKTSKNLSEEDRLKQAVKDYDALLEAQGAGNVESRLARLSSLPSGTSGVGTTAPEQKSPEVSMREWIDARNKRARMLRNKTI